ncbi:LysR family transcriptional regulator [Xanthobacter sp. TB0136]|uniref:LysR family transcriptional regulator n=1 Tax=Xanthobacter sp. TB0136 TaxID=3459177 RepID=UPI00403A3912
MKHRPKSDNPFSDNGKWDDEGRTSDQVSWDDARVFLAIARTGTLSGAAEQLRTGLATVSRRISRLEHGLGVALFTRHQTGYRLTDEGEALLARAEVLEQAGHAFGDRGLHQGVAGRVRLATAENLANPLIIPALPPLLRQHPDLTLEVVSDVGAVNLHRRDADLAVRMVKPQRGNVVLRRLGRLGFGLYGAPDYVARRRADGGSVPLADERFIGWVEQYGHLPAAQWMERALRGRPLALMTSTLSAQLSAAQAGIGLAVVPHFLARRAGLACVAEDLGVDQQIWLVIHADLAHSRRIRVVADYLAELFSTHRALLSGTEHPE